MNARIRSASKSQIESAERVVVRYKVGREYQAAVVINTATALDPDATAKTWVDALTKEGRKGIEVIRWTPGQVAMPPITAVRPPSVLETKRASKSTPAKVEAPTEPTMASGEPIPAVKVGDHISVDFGDSRGAPAECFGVVTSVQGAKVKVGRRTLDLTKAIDLQIGALPPAPAPLKPTLYYADNAEAEWSDCVSQEYDTVAVAKTAAKTFVALGMYVWVCDAEDNVVGTFKPKGK